ncbi:MAG: hypothetical protein ACI8Y3_000071 [Paraglaciecola sp.]|jgi:hypothetical protein
MLTTLGICNTKVNLVDHKCGKTVQTEGGTDESVGTLRKYIFKALTKVADNAKP